MKTFLILGICLVVFIGGTEITQWHAAKVISESLKPLQQENEWLRLELKKYRKYARAASDEIRRLDGENVKLKKKLWQLSERRI